jgi:PAS domain S-box-containing protein
MPSVTELSAYVLEPIREGPDFTLYRGRQHGNPSRVLAVALAAERPSPQGLRRLEHEYSLAAELDSAWAAKPLALTRHEGRTILILMDPGGEPLDLVLQRVQLLDLTCVLRIAIGLATALGQVHRRGLIHKDLKPGNVLVDDAGKVWLTGFAIASRLPHERQAPAPPEIIDGTLAYMAPEQTGRMNRSIDSRSDLYAFGVTLYEMLTGRLPFTASDPMEWVHCHIARQPAPPSERLKNVPGSVSAIIMKLLAKTAEERYQTAVGAESDLRRCLAEWETQRRIEEFALGEHDTPDRLLIPEKLYGRDSEIEALVAAFDRVVAGARPELVLVSGYSGIGKSSVVNELHKPLVPPRGLFASGKFDQYKRDIPYSTLAQAFQALLRPLLTKNETELGKWRDALQDALGPNAKLIVNLVPELQLIIGEPPPVPDLPPQDAQRRFQFVFRRFIGVFARPEHPLALFLDDLQWLDSATLDLIEDLLTQSDVPHLMLIGAYRDNEVNSSHPLTRKLDAMRKAGAPVQEIVLAPLTRADVAILITDSFHPEPERAAALAELIHGKTAGNPFFVIQFISALVEEGLLTFDYGEGQWSWNLNTIRAKGYTDNVADLMVGKLKRLPIETQQALQLLACLGNRAEFAVLEMVSQQSSNEMHARFWEATRTGLVFRSGDAYWFLHDRVQEAAYSLIPQDSRANAHLRIGRLIAAATPPDKLEERIFEIVNQLNRGVPLVTSDAERLQIAELNLIAARRARASTAYKSALAHLSAGEALLSEEHWETHHGLRFPLALHRAECEFLTGEFLTAAERLSRLRLRAIGSTDLAAVACLRIALYTTDRIDRAVEVGVEQLRTFGIEWSAHPSEEEVRAEYDELRQRVGDRPIETLVDLASTRDADFLALMEVLLAILPAALFTERKIHDLAVLRMANLSLEHGYCDASPLAFGQLSMTIGPRFGQYRDGFRFGHLGVALVEREDLARFRGKVYCVVGYHVLPWTQPIQAASSMIQRALELAQETGDLLFVAHCQTHLISLGLASGARLDELEVEAERYLQATRQLRFSLIIETMTTKLALIRTLRGLTPQFGYLDDVHVDELRMEHHLSGNPMLVIAASWHWIRKMQARYLAGDYAAAADALSKAQPLGGDPFSQHFEAAEFWFYGALSHAASWDSAPPDEKQRHSEALEVHHNQLDIWAQNCPENFENRVTLVSAEIARIQGRELEAEHLYEQAIRSAHENGFVHNEAIANELAAHFYAARGFEKIAHAYLQDARYGYLRWGADGKVRQLDQLYPHLREKEPTSMIGAPVEHLDLATVIKVSQAVSGEIVLEKLIDTLMRTAIEHAGAERGLLILPRGVEQRIEAEATTSGDTVIVRLRDVPAAGAALPESIVHYVVRTRERVILDDASAQNSFSADTYIRQHRARSVLCLPLINQARLIGVLYLENNLTPRVFNPTRIAVLELLASQAAISLENASLYSDLQRSEAAAKQAEDKIRQSEREIRQLVDLMPQHVVVLGPERRRLYVNQVALDYHGVNLAEWESSNPRVFFHPDEWERMVSETEGKFARGIPHEIEVRLLRKDGKYRWFLLRWNPLRDEQGLLTRWVLSATDIDDRKEAEQRLQNENIALREEIAKASMFEETVGTSPALQRVLSRISKVAPTDSSVLITGETGTGKELVARAIHRRSRRTSRTFVSVNCAAIPRDLIASELFGHEKGAFTGATQKRLGRFELAGGGTIFLDEIGELPAETQIALLRVLQEHEFERVGGTGSIQTDVRVIAATNRDLAAAIAAGTFRSDLFYRLNVFPIEMPPLRERTEDIPLLVGYFIDRFSRKAGKSFRTVNKKSLDLLQAYPWPGNIRELQNVIERSVIVCESENFSVDESWLSRQPLAAEPRVQVELSEKLAAQEKEMIEAALSKSGGRVYGPSGAAAKLGIPRSTLESKIRSLKINKNRFKS